MSATKYNYSREQLLELQNLHGTDREIAEAIGDGCTAISVNYLRKRLGVPALRSGHGRGTTAGPTEEDKDQICEIYEQTQSGPQTSQLTGWGISTVYRVLTIRGVERGVRGCRADSDFCGYPGGTRITDQDYVKEWCPGHPRADKRGMALQHVIVAERMLGRFLLPGELVHHRNSNRRDNRPGNLEVMSNADHNKLHAKHRRELRAAANND